MRKVIRFAIVLASIIVLPLAFSLPAWAGASENARCQAMQAVIADGWSSAANGKNAGERGAAMVRSVNVIYANNGVPFNFNRIPKKYIEKGVLLTERIAFFMGVLWTEGYVAQRAGTPKAQAVTNIMATAGSGSCPGMQE